ncbi:MAG: LysR family transcriptional regulator [Raoultibacter sp.]
MEVGYLREFIVFSKTVSYLQASKELYVSQPTLRAHIRLLEQEVGISLTLKRADKLELSPAGKMLLKKAHDIVAFTDAALDECRDYAKGATAILVGDLGDFAFDSILSDARNLFENLYPSKSIDIRLSSAMCSNIESLQGETVDLVLFSYVRENQKTGKPKKPPLPQKIVSIFYDSEQTLFWIAKDSPLFKKKEIYASDLDGFTLLLGSSENMIHAGKIIQGVFEDNDVTIGVNNCPFASYQEYLFASTKDSFGVATRASVPPGSGCRVFEVPDFSIKSDRFVLYNQDSLDENGRLYIEILKKSIMERFDAP